VGGRITLNFDEGWKFHYAGAKSAAVVPEGARIEKWRFKALEGVTEGGEALKMPLPDLAAAGWRAVNAGDDAFANEKGFGWFGTTLKDYPGPNRAIHFTMVDDNGIVYLNGEKIVYHEGWDDPFEVPLDKAWKPGGRNELLVLVENTGGPGRMGVAVLYNAKPEVSAPAEAEVAHDDSSWRALDLPHDWSIDLPLDPNAPCGRDGGYFQNGLGWYRKAFAAPEAWRGKRISVEFDGVYMLSDVWINGRHLGTRPFGYSSFRYDATPYLTFGSGGNMIAVRADNSKQRNSRWYSGSGIYRHVRLVVTDPVHVGHWATFVTTLDVTAIAARVHVSTVVENESGLPGKVTLKTSILDPAGKSVGNAADVRDVIAGGRREFAQEVRVPAPELWSPDRPRLYRALTEVAVDGKMVDAVETVFGIRSIHYDAGTGFTLNGRMMKMKGACAHHDHGPLGSASYDRAEERKVELLKASGYNAIRTSHNPPSPGLLDACDRLGMLVIDEAFDVWRIAKLNQDYHRYFDEWWQRDLDTMVIRDRNHPCVVMWSIGNEVGERGTREGAKIGAMLAGRVHGLDPTRPVTAAICGVDKWPDTDGTFATLDVGGYNYQRSNYRSDHDRVPDRIMVATESNPPEAFEYWMDVLDLPYIIGDFVWTGYDYLGEASIGNARFEGDGLPPNDGYSWNHAYCGDIDICGFKRPQSYYRDILWGVGSRLYIAVHRPIPEGKEEKISYWGWPDERACWNWPGNEGKRLSVRVYSGCDKVDLYLNGKQIESAPTSRATKFMAAFSVPYEPGALKAVGYAGGVRVAEFEVRTAGEPAMIRLTPDRSRIRAGKGGLSYVTVEVLDRNGVLDPDAANLIKFGIEGPGAVAGVASGNPVSTELYAGNQRSAFQGRCLVVVKSAGKPGTIRLRAEAGGLAGADAVIKAD
jgi:beta-galactosidase